MQNMVVPNVAMPLLSRTRQACNPSHVAGTLIQILFESTSGAKFWAMDTIPVFVSVKEAVRSKSQVGMLTFGILHSRCGRE